MVLKPNVEHPKCSDSTERDKAREGGRRERERGERKKELAKQSDDDLWSVRARSPRGFLQSGTGETATKRAKMRGVRRRGKPAGADGEGPHEVGGGRVSHMLVAVAA